jgi:hypothetical protein
MFSAYFDTSDTINDKEGHETVYRALASCCLLGLLFDPEDGSSIFLRILFTVVVVNVSNPVSFKIVYKLVLVTIYV